MIESKSVAGADHRQRVPVDAVTNRLREFGDLPALLRAGLEEPVKAEVIDHRLDALRADSDPAAVSARRDQVRLSGTAVVPSSAGPGPVPAPST